jgi:hypothetical protein
VSEPTVPTDNCEARIERADGLSMTAVGRSAQLLTVVKAKVSVVKQSS